MSVKTRITLLVVGAGFFASLLFSVIVFLELMEQPFRMLDDNLEEEAQRAFEMVVRGQREFKSGPFESSAHSAYSYWIEIYDQGTDKILYRSDLARSVELPHVEPDKRRSVTLIVPNKTIRPGQDHPHETTFRIRTFSFKSEGGAFVVQIARSMEKLEEEIREVIFGIVSGLIFSTLALIVVSHFIAGKVLKPIGAMKDLAQNIGEKSMDQRISVGAGANEFNELAKTINRMLDRLQHSFARQRELLFDTSHELKTPLSALRLGIDEICTSDSESLPLFTTESLFRLRNQVLRMERLVKDLLNLSSLEALTAIKPEVVDLTELLSSLAAEYRFLADARDIHMEVRLHDQLAIQGDAEKLKRAFSNILDNAIKYNVDGGQVQVFGDQSPFEVTIILANTGPGVTEAESKKVFEQFYRVEKSRSIQHGGSGLGLTIVKKIVELHRGKVEFESEPGGWTRVTVSLPRSMETTS
jgi:two-component system OmpR family sensor kinase